MVDAFTEAADFSGMSPEPLQLTEIVHKTFVRVDEEGTEAAAATGVVAGPTSAPQPPQLVVRFDRPFLFFIRDLRTGALLFVGRVASPG
jgi:serpin B